MLSVHSHFHTININIIITPPSTASHYHAVSFTLVSYHQHSHNFTQLTTLFRCIITKVKSKCITQKYKVFHRTFSYLFPKEENNFSVFLEHFLVLFFFTLSCCTVRIKNIYCTVWKLLCKTLYHAAGIYAVC
jgi:hypothetical protein